MAINPSTSTSRHNSPPSALIIRPPHPLVFYPPPPPLPLVMVPSPFGMYYYTIPTYYTPHPLPLYTYPPFPIHQSPTAAATSSDNYDGNRLQMAHTQTPPPPPTMDQQQEANPTEGGAADSWTTLMIMNIPYGLRRDFLLKFLDGYCKHYQSLEYDFFHLPLDPMRRFNPNLGYAFVNFTSNDGAKKMMEILNGYKWEGTSTDDGVFINSEKVCKVIWARSQGKEAQIQRFERSKFKCDDEAFSAVIFYPPRSGSHPTPPVALRRSGGLLSHPH